MKSRCGRPLPRRMNTKRTTRPMWKPSSCRNDVDANCRRRPPCVQNGRNCSRTSIYQSLIPEPTTGSATREINELQMSEPHRRLHEALLRDLEELRLGQIAASYREMLDEAARMNSSMLQVLASLVAGEVTARRQRALERRIAKPGFPGEKRWKTTTSRSPNGFPNKGPAAVRLRVRRPA